MGMAIAGGLAISSAAAATPTVATAPAPYCAGQYADDFGALSAAARDFDHRPEATFSYCTRNVAVYECLSYASDGSVRRARRTVTLHGTAFAYRKQSGDTWLLTNDHVGAWPVVTDDQHVVDGVSPGCKRVSETLTLVDDEHDSYGKDDISVTRVVTDPELDIAVLKARADLQVMPWKIGHSAGIRERNLVEVRGFPARCLPSHQHREGHLGARSRRLCRLGPRRLHRRRAAVQGELRITGARNIVRDRRVRAGGRLSRRLLRGDRAQRRDRDRSGARSDGDVEACTAASRGSGCDGRRGGAARCCRGPRRRRRCLLPVRRPGRAGQTGGQRRDSLGAVFQGVPIARGTRAGAGGHGGLRFDQLWIAGPHLARLDARAQGVRFVGAGCRRPGADQARARGAPRRSGRRARLPGRRGRRRVAIVGRCRAPAGEGAGPGRRVSRRFCSRRSQNISQTKALPSPAIEVCDSRRWADPNSRRRSRPRLRGRPSRVYPALRHRLRYRPDRAAMHTVSETRNCAPRPIATRQTSARTCWSWSGASDSARRRSRCSSPATGTSFRTGKRASRTSTPVGPGSPPERRWRRKLASRG